MGGKLTIGEWLGESAQLLQESDTPKLDAEILLAFFLEQSREYLYSHQDMELAPACIDRLGELVGRRQGGEPIAYITGKRDFWDVELNVTPDVLVPRPETELLVEAALELFAQDSRVYMADLGTGSGAIAIALAKHRPAWRVAAVDASEQALAVAKANALQHKLLQIEFIQTSWCEGLEKTAFDLIVANPPYVSPDDPHLRSKDLSFEPLVALQSGGDGFADLFTIASSARDHLKAGGWLLMEHGFDQHERLCEKLLQLGYTQVEGRRDLAGHWRMVQAQLPVK